MNNDLNQILDQIIAFEDAPIAKTTGVITSIADGVAKASGLSDVGYLELVSIAPNSTGVAINLETKSTGILIFGPTSEIVSGAVVTATGKTLSIGVSDDILGRVIDPLGKSLDGKSEIKPKKIMPLEKVAPGVMDREPVTVPMQTGIKAIDCLVPIGRGQRELVIGDRGTGKTTIGVDAIINQKDTGVVCVYVAIGQKASKIAQTISHLSDHNAMSHTVIVAAAASSSAGLQYIAPYAGAAVAEYFMDQGKDVLVVYDDLTKHAWAYRQVSLILKRPSGREAYPGDVFYLHSRLLERACRLNAAAGGGSITALPIIETQAGDISAYIPTNVISITDGQIFLEPELFYQGIRPAISVGLSVSRVGGNAQVSNVKQVAGPLRLDLAQYRAMAAFAQFATDLDESTRNQLNKGIIMTELLKQKNGDPRATYEMVAALWIANKGYLADVPKERITEFESGFLGYLKLSQKPLIVVLKTGKKLDADTEKLLETAIISFKKTKWLA